jgi:hypothetical protein
VIEEIVRDSHATKKPACLKLTMSSLHFSAPYLLPLQFISLKYLIKGKLTILTRYTSMKQTEYQGSLSISTQNLTFRNLISALASAHLFKKEIVTPRSFASRDNGLWDYTSNFQLYYIPEQLFQYSYPWNY